MSQPIFSMEKMVCHIFFPEKLIEGRGDSSLLFVVVVTVVVNNMWKGDSSQIFVVVVVNNTLKLTDRVNLILSNL